MRRRRVPGKHLIFYAILKSSGFSLCLPPMITYCRQLPAVDWPVGEHILSRGDGFMPHYSDPHSGFLSQMVLMRQRGQYRATWLTLGYQPKPSWSRPRNSPQRQPPPAAILNASVN